MNVLYRYSATQWIFGNEPIETSLKRLQKFGYDGVELTGEPSTLDIEATKRSIREHGLVCTSICGIFNAERDLSSVYPGIRAKVVQYVKHCVDMAAALSASHTIVVPSPVGKKSPDTTYEAAWENAVSSLREAAQYAAVKT